MRARCNAHFYPYDFIFLSRAGFNGMMRFNRKGEWNVPFCKKAQRFSPAYITKICNQVENIAHSLRGKSWEFHNSHFLETIAQAKQGDIIYCDPPYFGRYADYYNGWTEEDERSLQQALLATRAYFILSTWHHNAYRQNEMIGQLWDDFTIRTVEHFYHTGASVQNRHSMTEALVFNFTPCTPSEPAESRASLFML